MTSGKKIKEIMARISLLVFSVSTVLAIVYIIPTMHTKMTMKKLEKIKSSELTTISSRANSTGTTEESPLLQINPDYKGWLNIPGTAASGPVVQGYSNAEYLRKNFFGKKSTAGTFFLDSACDSTDKTSNLIIYGHLMNDGTMFGDLKKYKKVDFFKSHTTVEFNNNEYKLFAAMLTSGDPDSPNYFNVSQWGKTLQADEKTELIQNVKKRASVYETGTKHDNKQYIFLVTCDYSSNDGRLILVGEKAKRQTPEVQNAN